MNFQQPIPEGYEAVQVYMAPISRKADKRPRPNTFTATDLCEMEFAPVKFTVPGYIAEGLTLFAGKPKLGKSWLCMDVALAVAEGGQCLGGIQCEQGDVLYLALEDNRRRLQSRIQKLWQLETQARCPVPQRLHLATEWHRATGRNQAPTPRQ